MDDKYSCYLDWPPDPFCVGCRHYRKIFDNHKQSSTGMVCHYLIDTGHVRGCQMGQGCTKKEVDPNG